MATPRKGGDQSDAARQLGKCPDARPCPVCGRSIGGFYMWTGFQFARHRNAQGKRCRIVRAPVTGEILSARAITETKG